jgi:predicted ester cyclase
MANTPQLLPARPLRRAGGPAALVRRLVEEACNEGDLSILDELMPGSVAVDTGAQPGAVYLRQVLLEFRAAVPHARWEIVEQVAARNTVVTRLEVHGTFSGALVGLAPPGRPATVAGVAISRFVRGRLESVWLQADLLGFLQQLGVLPPLGLAQAVTMARVLRVGALLADGLPP